MTGPYRVLVTGSRYWPNPQTVHNALDDAYLNATSRPFIVVHGDCRTGADRYAHLWAVAAAATCNVIEEPYPADWNGPLGKAAGPERNRQMVDDGADLCLAFLLPNSIGTRHTMRLAETAGIPVKRFEVNQ